MPEISVIILTFNSSHHIEKLLKSLTTRYEKALHEDKLEIVVADNDSTDNTPALVNKFENIKFFRNGGNFGFAKGINMAVRHASGENLLFINPDAVFLKGDLFDLSGKLDNKIGVVGGQIFSSLDKVEPSCGKFYNLFNVLLLALGIEERFGVRFSPENEKFVSFVSGGFFMVKREFFEKMKGFDENFFMYIEDMEFCYRVKKQNMNVLFSPEATLQHVGQGSSGRSFAIVNIYKGLLYFHKKHMGVFSLLLVKFILGLKAVSLVMIGRISNNKYLYSTYAKAFAEII